MTSRRRFLAGGAGFVLVPMTAARAAPLPLRDAAAGAEGVATGVPGGAAPTSNDALVLAGIYTMQAAPNDIPPRQHSLAPFFGKHQSWAYSPREKAAYLYGGDGGSDRRVSNSSHGWHYGRLHLDSTPPVFDYFYPYLGIAGQVCPSGADCVPWVYDSKRNCFWQIGGYQWGITKEPWIGTPEARGVWRFDPVARQHGRWTQVSKVDVPYSGAEGMSGFYHPRLDMVIGLSDGRAWWYGCADDSRGTATVPMVDGRDVGRYCAPGYDPSRDELYFVTPINGRVVAAKLADFPRAAPSREIAQVPSPGAIIGQFPSLFVPSRRQFVLFYYDRIRIVDVDTGTVTDGPGYRGKDQYINAATYAPDLDIIVGTYKDSSDVAVLKWAAQTERTAGGEVVAAGKNRLKDIDPDPKRAAAFSGMGGFGAVANAWGGSAYAPDLGPLGSILVHNGGDADYWGNGIYRFDFSTSTWSVLSEPYAGMRGGSSYIRDPGYDPVKGLHAAGQPSVPHNYDSLQYIPPTPAHPQGVLANVVRLYCYGPRSPVNSSYFDIAAGTWSVAANATQRNVGTLNTVSSVLDASRGRIWYRGDGNIDRVGWVDTTTFDHGVVRIPGTLAQTNATSARDPLRDRWVCLGRVDDQGTCRLSAADLSNLVTGFRNIALTGAPLPTWNSGFDWCPELDCGFAYFSSDPQAVYRFAPGALNEAWKVSRIALRGTRIRGSSLPLSKWRWASKLGAFYLLTQYDEPVWICRPQ